MPDSWILDENPVPIDEFMRRALHDPELGYYGRRIQSVGRRGDFTTVPMRGRGLARAVAAWALAALRESACYDLIELGPGEGRLAADVWQLLPWWVRWRFRLHLVETSAPLREIQRRQSALRHVIWHDSPAAALSSCDGRAVIFSNELVDAFPARVFVKADDRWDEIAVMRDSSGRLLERALKCSNFPDSSLFDRPYPIGQRIEVHESYQQWLSQWMPLWRAGRLLTIDYGGPAESLYHRRPHGSLRAYLMHQRLEGMDVYEHAGRQDITADVNFSDLQAWSQSWVSESRLGTLAEFAAKWNASGSSCPVLSGEGAGDSFWTLDQKCRG